MENLSSYNMDNPHPQGDVENPPPWVKSLLESGMVTEVYKFSKFIHGSSVLHPPPPPNPTAPTGGAISHHAQQGARTVVAVLYGEPLSPEASIFDLISF